MSVTLKDGPVVSDEKYTEMMNQEGEDYLRYRAKDYSGKYFDTTIYKPMVKEKKEKTTPTAQFDDSAYKELERQAYVTKMQNLQNAKQIAAANGQTGGLAQTTMYQPNIQYGQNMYDIGVQKVQDKTAWQEQQAEIARQQKQYQDSLAYQQQQFAYQQQQDKLANELTQSQLAASERADARDLVLQWITYGIPVSDELLKAAGMSRVEANAYADYVKKFA